MKNYNIAFFTADWNYELVETTLQGLKQYVDDHKNISLRVFDCFGKDIGSANDMSEFAIFKLADLNQFDGILIQGSQIILKSVRDEIGRRVRESGIPAVTIDCPIPGCTLVSVDNRLSMRDITNHLIRRHGARRLVHLTGIMENGCPEGKLRRDGFLDACRQNHLAEEDVEVIECTWRTSDGYQVASRWLEEGRELPDAFVCANDEMALGIIEALSENGRLVPEDVMVTGFDNLSSAELCSPRLSTVDRDCAKLNYVAMDILIGKINGTVYDDSIAFPYTIVNSESCGCHATTQPDFIRMKYFHQTRFLRNFYVLQDQMAEKLFDGSTLQDLRGIIEQNYKIFGCDNIYLCINDYYFDNYEKSQWDHDSEAFGDEMVLTVCGRNHAASDDFPRFPTRQLLPEALINDARFLVFYPLHYNTYSIGYLVMDGISEAAKLNLHKSIFSFLEIAIENVRKKGLLHNLNGVLDNLYVHDALTGLYNRFGFSRYGYQIYDNLLAEDGRARILFIDMDDMKKINDQYGHEYGDSAICATARILEEIATPRDFLMRYGGDEFLMIAACDDRDPVDCIQRAVDAYNQRAEMPFTLSLSIGVTQANAGDEPGLDKLVQNADTDMYKYKIEHKSAASF